MSLFTHSGYEAYALSSPRSLIAIERLGITPDELIYRPQIRGTGRRYDAYLDKIQRKLAVAKQMVEMLVVHGVTEEEGERYNVSHLVSANPLPPDVIDLCNQYRAEMTPKKRPQTTENRSALAPTPVGSAHCHPASARSLRQSTGFALATSQPLSFEDRIAQKKMDISNARSRMIARAEAILREHAEYIEEKKAQQAERSERRYQAVKRLMQENEAARRERVLTQEASRLRKEKVSSTLAELELNRMTLAQYNLHVKEMKRMRFLELKEWEREEQQQRALLRHFYTNLVQHRREKIDEQKRELALLAVEEKQRLMRLLDQEAITAAYERGSQICGILNGRDS